MGRFGVPDLAFFTSYTFNPAYFQATFGRLLQGDYEAWERRDRVGLVVVVDGREYPGGANGNWVRLWPERQLFHPKLVLLVFRDATVAWASSGNLTPQGQEQNLEVAGRYEWDRRGIPAPLVELVSKVGGPVCDRLLKLDRLDGDGLLVGVRHRLSRDLPLGRSCTEFVCVSPFLDEFRPGSRPFLVETLRKTRPPIARLFLPATQTPSGLRVCADRRLVREIAEHVGKVLIHPIADEPLHAKLLAFVRGESATVFVGSANATRAAWEGANVEAVWRTRSSRETLARFLPSVRALPLSEVRFARPLVERRKPPCPVTRLEYSRRKKRLLVEFAPGHLGAALWYAGRRLRVRRRTVTPFVMGREWTVEVREGKERWFVPIDCVEAFAGLPSPADREDLSPEELLSLLSGLPPHPTMDAVAGAQLSDGSGVSSLPTRTKVLDWFDRARRLSQHMHSARMRLDSRDTQFSQAEADATVDILERAFDAHDPHARGLDPQERTWRYWVQVEVVGVLARTRSARSLRTRLSRRLRAPRSAPGSAFAAVRKVVTT